MPESVSHLAYSDEAYYNKTRFRSVALVSLGATSSSHIINRFDELIGESGISEFKWEKLRQAREKFAAIKLIDETFRFALGGELRIDVLVWDTQDSRHTILRRDDIANLQRMYYRLFRDAMLYRWPNGSTWNLFPDEHSALDWYSVEDYLDLAGTPAKFGAPLLEPFRSRLKRTYSIQSITPVPSIDNSLVQVADLFAGLGAYSHEEYGKYQKWCEYENKQLTLGLVLSENQSLTKLSNSEQIRCGVISYLDKLCKRHRLSIALQSTRGFKSHKPNHPINFWVYEPQHEDDKAPTKK